MYFKKILNILPIFLILIVSLGVVSAQENETQTFEDIQMKIDSSSEDTIKLSGNYSGENEIKISKSITIEGNAVLNGKNSTKIISAEDVNLTFKNITFENGNDTLGYGGAVLSSGELTFINCNFRNNNAFFGGAIASSNSIYLINCTFINNHANYGGAVFNYYLDEVEDFSYDNLYCDIDISNSTFINNSAETVGGAVYSSTLIYDETSNELYRGDCYIDRSTFINNIASVGGAIFSGSDLSISNSSFSKNQATGLHTVLGLPISLEGFGSAIASNSDYSFIENSTFISNKGDFAAITLASCEGHITNCSFKNNSYGSIHIYDSQITINNKKYKDIFLNDALKSISPFKVTTSKITTFYNSGKTLNVKIINKFTKKPIKLLIVKFKVYTGKKFKIYTARTNNKGIASLKASSLSAGTHKVEITTPTEFYKISKITTTVKITKAKTNIKSPKVTNKYKKSSYFKVTVKSNKKAVKNLKLKVKVYTGKKYKTYNIKTNSKGIGKLNTKSLSKGNHKVIITSGNNNYNVNGKSTIKIR